MDDNDLDEMPDFDASVSSINSDCERVDSVLIKKILSEMKSEFTRGTAGSVNEAEEKCDSFDESSEVYDVIKKGNGIQNNISGVNVTEDSESRDSNTHDESNENSVIESKTPDDVEDSPPVEKPRIILTLRTNEEDRENGSKFTKSNQVSLENLSDVSDNSSVINQSNDMCSQPETPVVERKQTLLEGRSKRNLRSRYSNSERDVEQSGLKRSSRRFSKEYGRESVLQNAIARKEKSFNSLNPSEERSYRRGARSPRHSYIPNEVKQTKSGRNKSPKQLAVEKTKSQNCSTSESSTPASTPVYSENERPDSTTTLESNKETDLILTRLKSENDALTDDSNENINLNRPNAVSVASDNEKTPANAKTNPLYYTKTGKRRSRYFKGLKYSLTGGSVRKKALALARRGLRKTVAAKENPPVEVTEEPPTQEEPNVADMPAEEAVDASGEKRSPSPAVAEACHSNALKRKSQPDLDDSEDIGAEKRSCEGVTVPSSGETEPDVEPEKYNCEDVPSPSTGEVESGPDKPESTAIAAGVGTAGICHCNSRVEIYASPASCRAELYCQAVDSLDGRFIGCCNTVDKNNARLVRPSIKVPYLVLCEVHHQRLQRHNCCPGCGNFCTQGKFMQCWAYHHYHKDCQLMEDDKPACPHCGSDSATDVNISLGAHKYPVFLPLQKPSKELPSAKMSFSGIKIPDGLERQNTPPLVPPAALILPSGLQISAEGLPPSLDKDKLENLLHVACSINSDTAPQPRYSIRNMYQAAKAGDAEKMIYMLASGLNPNHIFREWGMGSALHAASSCGHLAVVHLLVQAGANTDVLDREQNTPLMLAASNSHNEVVKYLAKAGASVTFKGGDGMTALHLAAKSGNVEACYYLVSNPNTPHSYIDTVDDGRWTPLVWAAEHCHIEVVRFLLERRADPLVRDAEQNIALHWAALAGSVDIAEALLNYGSDVNSTNAHGDTPLHIAARQNAYGCVVLLLARGARVDMHNRAGFVPLDCCIVNPSDTYTAIKLNVELRALMLNINKRSHRILTNDITRGYESNPIQCINSVDDEPEPQDFVYITENCFTSNINIDRTITSLQSCKCRDMCSGGGCMCGKISIRCWYDDEGKLLPDFNFADPPMLFECNQACSCNQLMCKNRVVQHGITARFQLFRTRGNKGWGVSTLRLIPKGAYVCEYIGEIISDCEADTREDDSYLFDLDNRDGETYCIDARRYGNIARFINHSCVPNLLPVRVFIDHQDLHFPRIAFFANRDIQANEELGFDYGEKFWIIKYKSFTCTCGSENCRYSENTIELTLDNYNRKLQQEENP